MDAFTCLLLLFLLDYRLEQSCRGEIMYLKGSSGLRKMNRRQLMEWEDGWEDGNQSCCIKSMEGYDGTDDTCKLEDSFA